LTFNLNLDKISYLVFLVELKQGNFLADLDEIQLLFCRRGGDFLVEIDILKNSDII